MDCRVTWRDVHETRGRRGRRGERTPGMACKGKMRNAGNSQRVKCGKCCAERSSFYPLFIFRLPHSAFSGGWSLHGTLAIDLYVHVHKTLFKLIFACMYNVWK